MEESEKKTRAIIKRSKKSRKRILFIKMAITYTFSRLATETVAEPIFSMKSSSIQMHASLRERRKKI